MAELHLEGYITTNYDEIISLTPDLSSKSKEESIIDSIEGFAEIKGTFYEHDDGLGGRISCIENCNLRIYYTSKKCTLEEAMQAMDVTMYGNDGTITTRVDWVGYSEYTITGLYLEDFSIGGHDLEDELIDHYKQYAHILIDC